MKRCQKCKEFKELICFYKNKSNADGFSHHCKICGLESQRNYHQANAKKLAERRRKYRHANAEKIAEYNRKYRQENVEKTKEAVKKWRLENPEKSKKISNKWKLENQKKYNQYIKEYQQKQKQEQAANLFFQMAHFASEIAKTTPPTPWTTP